ncbi:MAG TPA: Clp protease N-terminal domain-containing protein [Actinocrinis sp.]|nr:Clp protease N-terminal domain-containing protein [Actinocrinis sp.]
MAAKSEARRLARKMVDTEHLLLGLARENDGTAIQILTRLNVDREMIRDKVSQLRPTSPPEKTNPRREEPAGAKQPAPPESRTEPPALPSGWARSRVASEFQLTQFGPDLVRAARNGWVDPVVPREKEIQQIIRVLARRSHNSPLLVGDKGVGKTSTIIGLAKAVATDLAGPLSDCGLYELAADQLFHNVQTQADLDNRLRRIREAARESGALLFIDDLDRFLSPNARWANVDPWPALTSMLFSPRVRTIGIVTGQEAADRVRSNPALESALYEIQIDEPSVEEAVEIVASRRQYFEAHHSITFTPEAIAAAVVMAPQYDPAGFLPSSALDLIDEVGSHVQVRPRAEDADSPTIVDADTIAEVVAERVAQRSRQRPPTAIPMSGGHITPAPHPGLIDGDPEIWSMV